MDLLITILTPFADLIKIIGIVGGGALTFYRFFKKFFTKELQDNLEGIRSQLMDIKNTNEGQAKNIQMVLDQQNTIINIDRDQLKTTITEKYYRYKDQKYFPVYERECLTLIYEDYKSLHGNSFIDSLYKELMSLPSEL